ncbi:hypothetical protein SCLCIDRAFT_1208742 [Scleroderma citrinum Foug A]|uniref:Major facilitator superfamily (MFS) profile domain-containing protein n=1 Tax=Scleroderma citrinum Foug A TaxID=1036808 RepID=A0A0C3EK21_9AGAM|nr:hypothetical protein SCLCIDRAFT_1208742 [Scleroderma citrinum Foug A]
MSHTLPVYRRLGDSETHSDVEQHCTSDSDMDPLENAGPFGSPERRRQVEKKLLQKLDQRVAFLVLVYIMNYVTSLLAPSSFPLETYLSQDGQK